MPYKDPIKNNECKKRWRDRNREARTTYQRNFRNSHPEYRKREYIYNRKWLKNHPEAKLFYKNTAYLGEIRMLIELGGCCVFCFNTHPSELESHHPFGRKEFPNTMIQVCHDCHTLLHHKKRSENARNIRLAEWGKNYEFD